MTTLDSLRGRTFGCLTVLRDPEAGGVARKVRVRCVCGVESLVAVHSLNINPGRVRCSVSGCADRQRARGAA